MEDVSMAIEKVTLMETLGSMLLAPLAGVILATTGVVVSLDSSLEASLESSSSIVVVSVPW